MGYGDEGLGKFNMVKNMNYDMNKWVEVWMKRS